MPTRFLGARDWSVFVAKEGYDEQFYENPHSPMGISSRMDTQHLPFSCAAARSHLAAGAPLWLGE
jgi:hypothetical protein